jgi:glycine cleavage system H lipoate-binding protein
LKNFFAFWFSDDFAVPEDLKYAKSHEWVKVEGEQGTMGLTSFAVVRDSNSCS